MVRIGEFLRIVEDFSNSSLSEGEKYYDDCLSYREVWNNLSNVDTEFVRVRILPFLNRWRCRLPYDCDENLASALQRSEICLQPLRTLNIEDIDLLKPLEVEGAKMKTYTIIETAFDGIQEVKARKRTVAFTATSKILHMAIPSLFVMCDVKIRKNYGCEGNGAGYANFIHRMKLFARDLISQVHGDKQRILASSKRKVTLPKLLDVYNYKTFTRPNSS